MNLPQRPSVGFAFSGSGNRSTFYIGFLEGLTGAGVPIDYIAACSGGSLIAAAYGAGKLGELKELALGLNSESLKEFIKPSKTRSGLYSLAPLEERLRILLNGLTFEEAKPKMAFAAVDIDNGEEVVLCMGDVARAACISCSVPGLFEPTLWGNRILVDGGLLNIVPINLLDQAGIEVTIGINVRGTKRIFGQQQLSLKKFYNWMKRLLPFEPLENLFDKMFRQNSEKFDPQSYQRGLLEVLGKSLDVAMWANQKNPDIGECDYLIELDLPKMKYFRFTPETLKSHYEEGLKQAALHAPKILEVIKRKQLNGAEH